MRYNTECVGPFRLGLSKAGNDRQYSKQIDTLGFASGCCETCLRRMLVIRPLSNPVIRTFINRHTTSFRFGETLWEPQPSFAMPPRLVPYEHKAFRCPLGLRRIRGALSVVSLLAVVVVCIGVLSLGKEVSRAATAVARIDGVIKDLPRSRKRCKPDGPFTKETSFVPFPHRLVGIGRQLACEWKTIDSLTETDLQLLLGPDASQLDDIQRQILSEGVCIPQDDRTRVRLFSREDTMRCLSQKTLLFAGHDGFADVFTGIGDLLLPKPVASEMLEPKARLRSAVEVG